MPLRLFVVRFSTPSVPVILIKHWGTVPLMELSNKSRASRYVALHIELGMLPYNLLLERKMNLMEGRDQLMLARMEGSKLFPDNSKYSTCGIFGSCPWS
ncbi:hypothetical protein FH972_019618 [Carpinus fangiana]|uniref:Uncharacterized protein n=1 Tax=Carpinus fangiana TaxID=176857 RepID=A0A5N6RR75_9ROSI|nr:hypothetical protein FH972_019618 [Carpinus fangiana]